MAAFKSYDSKEEHVAALEAWERARQQRIWDELRPLFDVLAAQETPPPLEPARERRLIGDVQMRLYNLNMGYSTPGEEWQEFCDLVISARAWGLRPGQIAEALNFPGSASRWSAARVAQRYRFLPEERCSTKP